jgi:xylulokinase
MNCTLATELMRAPLGVTTADFDETISAVKAGSGGLVVLPFFSGERTPNLPRANASILGLTAGNCDRGHLLRATAEGATFGMRFGLDELRRLGHESSEIVLTGGGSKSREWCQIVADICRLPVSRLEQEEGASFGAALQALWLLQKQDAPALELGEIVEHHLARQEGSSLSPVPDNADRYDEVYGAYRRAVDQVANQFQESMEQSQ